MSAAPVAVKDIDKGWSGLVRLFMGADAKPVEAYVGTEVEYAPYLEYGTSKMAARPFVAWTLDEQDNYRRQLANMMRANVRAALQGADVQATAVANLGIVAEGVSKDIQRAIVGMGLIDTGNLLHSIHVLRIGEAEESAGGASEAARHMDWGTGA